MKHGMDSEYAQIGFNASMERISIYAFDGSLIQENESAQRFHKIGRIEDSSFEKHLVLLGFSTAQARSIYHEITCASIGGKILKTLEIETTQESSGNIFDIQIQKVKDPKSTNGCIVMSSRERYINQSEKDALFNDMKQSFAKCSHELRSPLNGIIGLSDMLMEKCNKNGNPSSSVIIPTLKTIQSCGCRMLRLVTEILDMTRFQHQKIHILISEIDLPAIVHEVFEIIKLDVDKSGNHVVSNKVELRNDIQNNFPIIEADKTRLTQVLCNLVSNGAKFTETGYVSVEAKVNEEENNVTISVKDTGRGICHKDIPEVFKMYKQGSVIDTFEGIGLGLPIADSLVQAHGGKIQCISKVNEGSTFFFTIPRIRGKEEIEPLRKKCWENEERSVDYQSNNKQKNEISAQDASSQVNLLKDVTHTTGLHDFNSYLQTSDQNQDRKKVILSVDDDQVNQMVVKQILGIRGYEVITAMNGFEALDYLEEANEIPDLILLDVMMPKMSGYEVCERARKMFPTSSLPIIMVSAKSGPVSVVEGLSSGCNDYISKPFDKNELVSRIQTQIRLRDLSRIEIENHLNLRILEEMIPQRVLGRLKAGERPIADSHPSVTILFADIVGFTELASTMPNAELVYLLNDIFCSFDELLNDFNVFKVETIGDAYMVASGHDVGQENHAVEILKYAQNMLNSVHSLNDANARNIQIRIGVHTGEVMTGVVGRKNPRFCFFGDTVNIASRMESHGLPDLIHLSKNTYEEVKNVSGIKFQSRGEILVKGKGHMNTYFVVRDQVLKNIHDISRNSDTQVKKLIEKQFVPTETWNNSREELILKLTSLKQILRQKEEIIQENEVTIKSLRKRCHSLALLGLDIPPSLNNISL